jgi:hypothetical protein
MLYRTKESNDTIESDTKKNKNKETNQKKEKEDANKKDAKKDQKAKKKNMSALLDNFNLISCEENIIARFDLELFHLLDGVTRQVQNSYSENISKNNVSNQDDKTKKVKSAGSDKKKSKNSNDNKLTATPVSKDKNNKKADQTEVLEHIELPPIEFSLSFEILDFQNFNQLRNYKR